MYFFGNVSFELKKTRLFSHDPLQKMGDSIDTRTKNEADGVRLRSMLHVCIAHR